MHSDFPVFSRTCYGYDRDEDKNLIINEQEATTVKKIFGWYIQGWSIVRIKKEMEASRILSPRGKLRWAVRTITDILSNEKYAGASFYRLTVTAESTSKYFNQKNHYPPILVKTSFDQIQEMRKMRSNIEHDKSDNKVRKILITV
jgi:site-specific DNA recombinase